MRRGRGLPAMAEPRERSRYLREYSAAAAGSAGGAAAGSAPRAERPSRGGGWEGGGPSHSRRGLGGGWGDGGGGMGGEALAVRYVAASPLVPPLPRQVRAAAAPRRVRDCLAPAWPLVGGNDYV